jgi:hypothetical protein
LTTAADSERYKTKYYTLDDAKVKRYHHRSLQGRIGIRLEDCLYVGDDRPYFFSKQSISIEKPFG